MPDSVLIHGPGPCPACDELVLTGVRCQWGAVPHPPGYKLGDPVVWLHDDAGQLVPPFTLRTVDLCRHAWNCGDPQYANVILFDMTFDTSVDMQDVRCPRCNTRIAAAIAVVRDGRFHEVRALADPEVDQILGASRGQAEIVIVQADGTLLPRCDWYDHSIT